MHRRPWLRRRLNLANAEQPSLSISLERQQIDLQKRLKKAIEDLRDGDRGAQARRAPALMPL